MELAKRFPIEIISADSRQIIRQLNIGTAKPTPDERARVPMHLFDLIDLGERYTAMRFIADASTAIGEVLARGRIPLVVGGTGLYLRALSEGVVEIESEDMALRERLEEEAKAHGADMLWYRLNQIDPLEAAKIHPNNMIRLIRALEIFYLTGKTKSEITSTGAYRRSPWSFVYHCLEPDRDILYGRINERVEEMWAGGLVQEVEGLCSDGWRERLESANVMGYNEVLAYLDKNMSVDEAIAMLKQNHRRYAKRQMTWFRHQVKCQYFRDSGGAMQGLETSIASFGRGSP